MVGGMPGQFAKERLSFGGANDETGAGGAEFFDLAEREFEEGIIFGVAYNSLEASGVDDIGKFAALKINGHEEAAKLGETGLEMAVLLRGLRPDTQTFLASGLLFGHLVRIRCSVRCGGGGVAVGRRFAEEVLDEVVHGAAAGVRAIDREAGAGGRAGGAVVGAGNDQKVEVLGRR